MNQVTGNSPNAAFLNQLYDVASQQGEGKVGLEKPQQGQETVPLAGRKAKLLQNDATEGFGIRKALTEALKDGGETRTDAENRILDELGIQDAPVPKPLAMRTIHVIRAKAANVDALVDKAVTVARVPDEARALLKQVVSKYPHNKHIAAFLDTYSQGKVDLKAFCLVCKLAAESGMGDPLGRAYLSGFAGDVRVEESLQTTAEREMRELGEHHRVEQEEADQTRQNVQTTGTNERQGEIVNDDDNIQNVNNTNQNNNQEVAGPLDEFTAQVGNFADQKAGFDLLDKIWTKVSDQLPNLNGDNGQARENLFNTARDLSQNVIKRLTENGLSDATRLFSDATTGNQTLPDDNTYGAAFDDILNGWQNWGEQEQGDDKKAKLKGIFKSLPQSMRKLMAEGLKTTGVRGFVEAVVTEAGVKLRVITGNEKHPVDLDNPAEWETSFELDENVQNLATERKIQSSFSQNLTQAHPRGVCEAATTLWVARQLKPNPNQAPKDLTPEDCDALQSEIEGSNGGSTFDIDFVRNKTGGTLQDINHKHILRRGEKINPELGDILESLPVNGFGFISASQQGNQMAHSMAIFRNGEDEFSFFDPDHGMFSGTLDVIDQIVGHYLTNFADASLLMGNPPAAVE